MIELVLSKIKVDENRHEQLVVFREKAGNRFLPVVIGLPEIHAIKLKLGNVKPPRPMTHDLMLKVVQELGGKIVKVVIDKLESNTFHAKIHLLSKEGQEIVVDSRPSDSVAIALRAQVPVFAEEEVLDKAGVYDV
ncbi:MAG TPA: bifunctional nuclease family protein [Candidatus Omnitrophota bacterium]|nr:bifunctional nuclease family protein [Candidatus Omnitrophota bacterium]HRY85259.1 bifunctional nuclease family protein [Candidatus Omnitrophota bacterium]